MNDVFATNLLRIIEEARLRMELVLHFPSFESSADANFLSTLKQLKTWVQELEKKGDPSFESVANDDTGVGEIEQLFFVSVHDDPRFMANDNSFPVTNTVQVNVSSSLTHDPRDNLPQIDDYTLEQTFEVNCLFDAKNLQLMAVLYNRKVVYNDYIEYIDTDGDEQSKPSFYRQRVLRYVLYPSLQRPSEVFVKTENNDEHRNNHWCKLIRSDKPLWWNRTTRGVFWAPFTDTQSAMSWVLDLVKWWNF